MPAVGVVPKGLVGCKRNAACDNRRCAYWHTTTGDGKSPALQAFTAQIAAIPPKPIVAVAPMVGAKRKRKESSDSDRDFKPMEDVVYPHRGGAGRAPSPKKSLFKNGPIIETK